MDFYEEAYQRYTNLSQALTDQAARKAAISVAAYLTTGHDITSMYHKALSQAKEPQGEAAKIYQGFVRQIERRFSPLGYVGDYCSFCGALSTEQLQTFLKDALESITAHIREEEQVVDAYHTSLEEKTDEEILAMCWGVDFICPAQEPAVNRQALLSIKSQVLDHLYESRSMLEERRAAVQVPQPSFKKGDHFCLSEEGLEIFGEEYRGIVYTVIQWYDHETSAEWFDKHGWDKDPHGAWTFDEAGAGGSCLYHTTFEESDLYEWHMTRIEPSLSDETIRHRKEE